MGLVSKESVVLRWWRVQQDNLVYNPTAQSRVQITRIYIPHVYCNIVQLATFFTVKNLFNRSAALLYRFVFSPHEKWVERLSRKKSSRIINNLLDVFGVKYCNWWVFLLVVCILTHLTGSSKYGTTWARKNTQRYYTSKRLLRYMYFHSLFVF